MDKKAENDTKAILLTGKIVNHEAFATCSAPNLPIPVSTTSFHTACGIKFSNADMCQLNVKSIARLGMNSQSHSTSHLKMTKQPRNF